MPRNRGEHLEPRNQGEHLERRKIKTAIIGLILGNNDSVPEPEIREFLREKYRIIDQGNIKRHLRDLQNQPYSCIEKIPPKRKGFANKWDIKKAENLKNIRINFPAIRLNLYEKSLKILLKERGFKLGSPNANKFLIQLYLSGSLFNRCIHYDTETYNAMNYEFYKDKYFDEYQHIKKQLNKIYTEFINRISKGPNIWLLIYEEYANKSLKSEFCENFLKCLQDAEISEEEFQNILEDIPLENIPFVWEEVEWGREVWLRVILRISIKISYEIFQQMVKEGNIQFTKPTEEILKRISEELLNRMLEGDLDEICRSILKVKYDLKKMHFISIPDAIFEHCYDRDIADGIASPEEKEFMAIIRKNHAKFSEKDQESALQAYNNFYIEYYKKCKEKNGNLIKSIL